MAPNASPAFDAGDLVLRADVARAEGGRREAVRLLASVVGSGPADQTRRRVEALSEALEARPETAHGLGQAVWAVVADLRIGPMLTESGVLSTTGFAAELGRRLSRRLLPEAGDPSDARTLLLEMFPGADDHERVESVPAIVWGRLLTALGIVGDPGGGVAPEVDVAIRTLAHHVGSLGTRPELTRRLPHLERSESPFLELSDRVLAYIRSYTNDVEGDESPMLAEALETVQRCRDEVAQLRATKGVHGTSLELTGDTFRLLQLLDRLELLLDLTAPSVRDTQASLIRLAREALRAEKTGNHIGVHVKERADLLIFQVVEHAAKKGSKYITSGRSDYAAFFRASMGGGFIVACFSLVKTLVGGWGLPLGVEAILFGLNYAACFVLIYVTGSALATKQPAMTANTIARALGDPQNRRLDRLEELVVRVWRSQFVSFVGNLALALPTGFLLSELFYRAVGRTVADETKALELLQGLHPWQSGTIFYAAVAGVFLFSAGLVSGWIDNRNLYSRIPRRIERHPGLRRVLGPGRSSAVAEYASRHLGAIGGNVFLGFALGSTGTLGEILGLPLDIRHIAFASAELGTGLEIFHVRVDPALVWQAALGVALIGLINFLVSFGLSLAMALESRQITWVEVRAMLRHLMRSFRRRPLAWFVPPTEPRPTFE